MKRRSATQRAFPVNGTPVVVSVPLPGRGSGLRPGLRVSGRAQRARPTRPDPTLTVSALTCHTDVPAELIEPTTLENESAYGDTAARSAVPEEDNDRSLTFSRKRITIYL
ncbi:hypothetical protein [Serinibacter arcticus]|nr:hypothetical protein [Serinibacter arcticus]